MTALKTQQADKGTTRKTLWKLFDGALVESVLMRYPGRVTICVSSQAGCGMACPFCATGQGGLQRNMSTGEIVEQVVAGARALARDEVAGGPGRISNVVFMGMGEPMANYKAVMGAVRRLTDPTPDGLGMSARGITVSTVGLVPRINQLAEEGIPVTLALSLHAPDDELRDELVPINTRWKVGRDRRGCVELREDHQATRLDRVRHDARHQRPGMARRPARRRAQLLRRLGLGARQPDPAEPDAGLEVDRERPGGRARVRPPARGEGHPHDRARHPWPRDRRRLRPARRARGLSPQPEQLVQSGLSPAAEFRHHRPMTAPATEAHLKADAIGFTDALVIGLAATSPAYSLAAVIGPIAALVGVYAPGVLLASFVPMALIATAFLYLNRVDQDCGTTFSWVTRAMGPWMGWIGGWAITMTGVLVIGSLADVGVSFTLLMVGADGAADNAWIRMPLAILLILLMTWICVQGTDISARLQNALIVAQVGALLVFAVVALYRAIDGSSPLDEITPSLSWLNPFGEGGAALSSGLLLGVFAYWGWESAVNLSEETTDGASAPGRAAVWSTFILLVTYVSVAFAVVAFAGTQWLTDNAGEEEFVFAEISSQVMGGWDWVVFFAVATSAIASTQTTIIPASRTGLSMARRHALPARLGRIHPRHQTPDVSTWWVAGIAIVWYVGIYQVSANALFDSLTALSLLIAFYYALTGVACAVFYRRHLLESAKNCLLIGIGPLIGSALLVWLLVLSVRDMSDPANSYSGQAWLGVGPPLVIGIGIFLAGRRADALLAHPRRTVLGGARERRRPRHRARPQGRAADPDGWRAECDDGGAGVRRVARRGRGAAGRDRRREAVR